MTNGDRDLSPEMAERDPVVLAERGVGDEGRGERERPAARRNRGEAVEDVGDRKVPEFPVEEPPAEDDGDEADDRPDHLAESVYQFVPPLATDPVPRPSESCHNRTADAMLSAKTSQPASISAEKRNWSTGTTRSSR